MTAELGTDLSCLEDLTDDCAMTDGRVGLAQSVVRRYLTPRGGLLGDPDYGTCLEDYLNDDMSATDLAALFAAAEAEALKDERVVAANVTGSLDSLGVLTITVLLTDADGPFRLVLAVSAVSTTVLAVAA